MTIAVADSLMNGRDYVETLQMWPQKYPGAGYGGWFNKWIYKDFPEPYNKELKRRTGCCAGCADGQERQQQKGNP